MKILITGGTGTISSALAQAAVEQNHEVFTVTEEIIQNVIPKGYRLSMRICMISKVWKLHWGLCGLM